MRSRIARHFRTQKLRTLFLESRLGKWSTGQLLVLKFCKIFGIRLQFGSFFYHKVLGIKLRMTVPNSRSGYGTDARDARNGSGGCSSSRSRGMGPSSYFMGGIIVRCYCGCCNSLSAMRSLSVFPFFLFYYFFRPNQHGNKIRT